ncbi:MAG: sugar phosphate isomerase/epimerase family protein [Mangrovicoccus sp.]
MQLAVSNLAWPAELRDQAYVLLARAGITGLEIAPSLFFPQSADPYRPSEAELHAAHQAAKAAGLRLVSMQSLLYGVSGAQLFGDPAEQAEFIAAMQRSIRLAGRLGIENLVFGAPKMRSFPAKWRQDQAISHAAEVFNKLADFAQAEGTRLTIEAVAAEHGTNFLTHGQEALDFLRHLDHPSLGWTLDLGNMASNDETAQIPELIGQAGSLLTHIHVSAPQLGIAPSSVTQMCRVFEALEACGYGRAVSIEMLAQSDDPLRDLQIGIERLLAARNSSAT